MRKYLGTPKLIVQFVPNPYTWLCSVFANVDYYDLFLENKERKQRNKKYPTSPLKKYETRHNQNTNKICKQCKRQVSPSGEYQYPSSSNYH